MTERSLLAILAVASACHPVAPARTAEVARTALTPAGDVIAAVEQGDAHRPANTKTSGLQLMKFNNLPSTKK